MLHLLIVDDNKLELMGIRKVLKDNFPDLVIYEAGNGDAALDFIAHNIIDIVISDIKMPLMDGITLSQKLSQHYPEIKILLLSAYGEFEYAQSAIRYGVKYYLLKPVNIKELIAAVTELCASISDSPLSFSENQLSEIHKKTLLYNLFYEKEIGEKSFKLLEVFYPQYVNKPFYLGALFFSADVFDQYEEIPRHLKRLFSTDFLILNETQMVFLLAENEGAIEAQIKKIETKVKSLSYLPKASLFIDRLFGLDEIFSSFCQMNQRTVFPEVFSVFDLKDNQPDAEKGSENLQTEKKNEAIINTVKDIINTRYQHDLSLDSLAESVFLSPSYLCSIFHRHEQKTLTMYICNVRLNKAIELLLNTNMKISDISASVGYRHSAYFCKLFKDRFGETPSEFRTRKNYEPE